MAHLGIFMRYLPTAPAEDRALLDAIGVNRAEDLLTGIPEHLKLHRPLDLPPTSSELEVLREMQRLADLNTRFRTRFLGAGAYAHLIPSAIDHQISRQEWFTAYTPYQPEISQGTLQHIFEYQTLICDLTGLDVTNASLYDGGTSCLEAALMAVRVQKKRTTVLVSAGLHPYYLAVIHAGFAPHEELDLVEVALDDGVTDPVDLAAKLDETVAEFETHFEQVRAVSRDLDLGFSPLGFHPLARREDMPWMPKGRYAIMRRYMPLVGSMGLDMMTRTCTVQVNLDYESEADMRRKLRASLLLQPLATALFANSPFTEGRENGFLSYRAHVWTDTDNQRSGIPAVMLEDGFGFERHAAWLVDSVPMYFVYRGGTYIDVAGRSFRDFMNGAIPELAGIAPTIGDFADHMTTAFTDVRLKRFLEMRGADAGRADMMVAQSALWVGLLYDNAALDAALALVRGMGHAGVLALRAAVPRQGLDTKLESGPRAGTLRDLARDVVAIAREGLRARNNRDKTGNDESIYLDPLSEIADGGPVQAEHWLSRNREAWSGDIKRIFAESAI